MKKTITILMLLLSMVTFGQTTNIDSLRNELKQDIKSLKVEQRDLRFDVNEGARNIKISALCMTISTVSLGVGSYLLYKGKVPGGATLISIGGSFQIGAIANLFIAGNRYQGKLRFRNSMNK